VLSETSRKIPVGLYSPFYSPEQSEPTKTDLPPSKIYFPLDRDDGEGVHATTKSQLRGSAAVGAFSEANMCAERFSGEEPAKQRKVVWSNCFPEETTN
jgi:hypothetical protein